MIGDTDVSHVVCSRATPMGMPLLMMLPTPQMCLIAAAPTTARGCQEVLMVQVMGLFKEFNTTFLMSARRTSALGIPSCNNV